MGQGVALAVDALNQGGRLPARLELDARDDGGVPDRGLAHARDLIAQGVVAIFGSADVPVSARWYPVAQEAGVLALNLSNTDDDVSPGHLCPGRSNACTVFRSCPSLQLQFAALRDWALRNLPSRRVAAIVDGVRGAKDISEPILSSWRQHGLDVVLTERIADDEAERPAQIERALEACAEAIFVPFYLSGDVARLAPVPVLTCWLSQSPRVGESLRGTAARLIVAGNFLANPADSAHTALFDAFRARYGPDAPLFYGPVAQGYETTMLLAEALVTTGGAGGSGLVTALEQLPTYQGLLDLREPPLGPSHELFRSADQIRLSTWQDGELVALS
ncbi:MAG: ABC transporter substrate-binding protein [Chloroflexi bacterium]|nr:ABC transporter substrate-binding protein [Chloroflexota bacterium]